MIKIKSLVSVLVLMTLTSSSIQQSIIYDQYKNGLGTYNSSFTGYKNLKIGDTMPKFIEFVNALPRLDEDVVRITELKTSNDSTYNMRQFEYKGNGFECEFGFQKSKDTKNARIDNIIMRMPRDTIYIYGSINTSARVIKENGVTKFIFQDNNLPKVEQMTRIGNKGLDMSISDNNNSRYCIDGQISYINTQISNGDIKILTPDKRENMKFMDNYRGIKKENLNYQTNDTLDTKKVYDRFYEGL